MTHPDHYRESERLVAASKLEAEWKGCMELLARAQVHATLAEKQEPAGHPVVPYREALTELREAALELLELLKSKNAAPPDVKAAASKVRALLGSPS